MRAHLMGLHTHPTSRRTPDHCPGQPGKHRSLSSGLRGMLMSRFGVLINGYVTTI